MRRILVIAAVPIGAAAVIGIFVLVAWLTPAGARTTVSVCLASIGILMWVVLTMGSGRHILKSFRENRIDCRREQGRCPTCGYDLRGTRRAGIPTCPECGATVGLDPPIAGAQDIAAIERALGGKLPDALRIAYVNGALQRLNLPITFKLDAVKYIVAEFHDPLEILANDKRVAAARLPDKAFVFASDDFGNDYFIKADGNGVYFWEHDGDGAPYPICAFNEFWKKITEK